ncbi:SDR family NAD(P)-dependent oxidoreductase [Nocardioides sp. HB32]
MKIALVTGANRGIGLAAARRLARECGHVILAARKADAASEAADRLVREGFSSSGITMDVTDRASVRAAAVEVSERFGHLDVLVNNAGILPEATNPEPKEVLDLAMFEQTYPGRDPQHRRPDRNVHRRQRAREVVRPRRRLVSRHPYPSPRRAVPRRTSGVRLRVSTRP